MRVSKHFLFILALFCSIQGSQAMAQKYVCMQTNQGEWCMRMFYDTAPNTANNFMQYVKSGHFNYSIIHIALNDLVIQGGGYSVPTSLQGVIPLTNYGTVKNEFARSNKRGTVAMAKIPGQPDSAANQWFINLGDNSAQLDGQNGGFTVFAEIAYGMEVVDKIGKLRKADLTTMTKSNAMASVPTSAAANASVTFADLVVIYKVYAADLLPNQFAFPYHCTGVIANETLTELCASEMTFPVMVGTELYEATLQVTATSPKLMFKVKPGSLIPLVSARSNFFATWDPVTTTVKIPSFRIDTAAYDNVVLKLTNASILEFVLESLVARP